MGERETSNKKVFHRISAEYFVLLVRLIGLEPTQLALLDPKSSASTNFATGACGGVCGSSKNCGCKGSVFFLKMPINRCFFVCF